MYGRYIFHCCICRFQPKDDDSIAFAIFLGLNSANVNIGLITPPSNIKSIRIKSIRINSLTMVYQSRVDIREARNQTSKKKENNIPK